MSDTSANGPSVGLDETGPVLFASDAAASGPPYVEVPVAYDAILLAGFGGPEGQDDVIPFLRNVTRGRGIPDERLEEVAHHYRHFGGVSPINAQNRALKAALEAELARRGIDLPVYWGNRNWAPYLEDAVLDAAASGDTTLLALSTSAYSSFSSCRQYREDFARVLTDTGLAGQVTIDKVRQFFDHPGFVEPFFAGVRDAVAGFLDEGIAPDAVRVLFSTHSIPLADAERSGPRDVDFGAGRRVRGAASRGRRPGDGARRVADPGGRGRSRGSSSSSRAPARRRSRGSSPTCAT